MPTMRVEVDVPESREVTLKLPPEVRPGKAHLTVTVDDAPPAVYEVKLDPSMMTKRAFPPRPTHPKLAEEHDAFQRLLPELLKTHRGQYAAVHNGEVVGVGPESAAVAAEAYRKFGNVPIYVQLITDEPQPIVRIPGFRVLERPPGE